MNGPSSSFTLILREERGTSPSLLTRDIRTKFLSREGGGRGGICVGEQKRNMECTRAQTTFQIAPSLPPKMHAQKESTPGRDPPKSNTTAPQWGLAAPLPAQKGGHHLGHGRAGQRETRLPVCVDFFVAVLMQRGMISGPDAGSEVVNNGRNWNPFSRKMRFALKKENPPSPLGPFLLGLRKRP